MARAGDVILNPAMGARIEFRTVARDADGSLLEFDVLLRPGGVIATDHLHPHQEERFTVMSGAVHGHVDGRRQTVRRGEASVVPAGVPHAWRNASDQEEAHLRVRFTPALDAEELFTVAFALGAKGLADSAGIPVLPLRLAMLAAFPHEFRPARMPPVAHRIVVGAMAPLGRRMRRRHGSNDMNSQGRNPYRKRLLPAGRPD